MGMNFEKLQIRSQKVGKKKTLKREENFETTDIFNFWVENVGVFK